MVHPEVLTIAVSLPAEFSGFALESESTHGNGQVWH
jgi:hypothetical protein